MGSCYLRVAGNITIYHNFLDFIICLFANVVLEEKESSLIAWKLHYVEKLMYVIQVQHISQILNHIFYRLNKRDTLISELQDIEFGYAFTPVFSLCAMLS